MYVCKTHLLATSYRLRDDIDPESEKVSLWAGVEQDIASNFSKSSNPRGLRGGGGDGSLSMPTGSINIGFERVFLFFEAEKYNSETILYKCLYRDIYFTNINKI